MTEFIHANSDSCIGCRTCEVACVLAHGGTTQLNSEVFSPRLRVIKHHQFTLPVMCHQCENAPCVAVCPTAALVQGERSVMLHESRCIGCKNCVLACPFGVIDIAPHQVTSKMAIIKCDLCQEHKEGPACITVCPTGALKKLDGETLSQQVDARRKNAALQSIHSSLK